MPLQLSTAPALFLGLGARIVLDFFNRTQQPSPPEPSISNFLLLGAWQGVGLYYASMEFPGVAVIVALAIGAKLFIEFTILPDVTKCTVTLIGVALGVMFTDALSQFLEEGSWTSFGGKRRSSSRYEPTAYVSPSKHRPRTVSFSRSKNEDTRRDREKEREWERARLHVHSDITAPSLDSTSDWIDRTARTPLEREVATLRARASLADTEKRRYKEERVWALAQGNQARAEQMAWQVKRYRALTHGFHKEADAKLLEGKSLENHLFLSAYAIDQPNNLHLNPLQSHLLRDP